VRVDVSDGVDVTTGSVNDWVCFGVPPSGGRVNAVLQTENVPVAKLSLLTSSLL